MWAFIGCIFKASIIILIIYYLNYLWSRRYFYLYSMNVPGPLSLPIIGSICFLGKSSDMAKKIIYAFDAYPGVFRLWLGTELVYCVSDPKYIEIIANHPKCLNKGPAYEYLKPAFGEGLLTATETIWRKNKKLVGPTFQQTILNTFVETFVDKSNELASQLEQYSKQDEIIPYHCIHRITLRMICATAMRTDIEQGSEDDFERSIKKVFDIAFLRSFVFYYKWQWLFNMTSLSKKLKIYQEKIYGFTEKILEKNTTLGQKKEDYNIIDGKIGHSLLKEKHILVLSVSEPRKNNFLEYLHKMNSEDNEKVTIKQLKDEVNTFIIAGSDSTALTISFVMTMLGLYHDVQKKVLDEVMDVLGPDRNIEATDLPHFKYTDMVIKETMRLFNVISYVMKEASADINLDDQIVIPKGSIIMIGIGRVHYHPHYWPNPKQFIPERFLPDEVGKRQPYTYLPFSAGPRSCIGRKYAMMAIKTVIATLVRKYTILTDYNSIEEIELKSNISTKPKDGYKLRIQARNI